MTFLIEQINIIFLALVFVALLVKMILFFTVEKGWDSIAFWYFTKPELKMTMYDDLRKWRKRQNLLSSVFLMFILLFVVSSVFKMLITSS